MLITLAIGSASGLAGCIITILSDDLPQIPRWIITAVVCAASFLFHQEEPIFRCGIVISPTTDWLRYGRKQAIVFPTLKLPFMWFILLRGQYSWKVLGRCSWSAILCSVKDRQTHSNDKKWYDIVDGFIPIQPGSTFSISEVQFPVDKCGHPVWLQSKLSF